MIADADSKRRRKAPAKPPKSKKAPKVEPGKEPEIRCSYQKLADPKSLKPNPRNPNKHSPEQIAILAKIIQHQGWRSPIVVSQRSGLVVAGHGRLEVALHLGVKQVPVDFQMFASDDDETAHLLADNKVGELAEMDFEEVSKLLKELKLGDLTLTGFPQHELDMLLSAEWTPGAHSAALVSKGGDNSVLVKFTKAQWKVLSPHIEDDDNAAQEIVDLVCGKKKGK
jgi:hypothetical protein